MSAATTFAACARMVSGITASSVAPRTVLAVSSSVPSAWRPRARARTAKIAGNVALRRRGERAQPSQTALCDRGLAHLCHAAMLSAKAATPPYFPRLASPPTCHLPK